jgi:cell division protein FtsW (lipid II flippase)
MFFYTFYLMGQAYLTSESKESEMALPIACAIAVLFTIRLVLSQPDNIPLIFVMFGMAIALYAKTIGLPRRAALRNRPDPDTAPVGARLVPAE